MREENLHSSKQLFFGGMDFIWGLRETINRKSHSDIFIELLCRVGLHLISTFSLFVWEHPCL